MDFSFEFSGALLTGNINPEMLKGFGILAGTLLGGLAMVWMVIMLAIAVLMIISRRRIFRKAGLPGWGAIIPFYNRYLMFKLGGRSGWNFLWILVPPVFFVLMIINCFRIAERFGKHWAYGFGIRLLKIIFVPILAFDDSKYIAIPAIKTIKKQAATIEKKTSKQDIRKPAKKKAVKKVKTLKR